MPAVPTPSQTLQVCKEAVFFEVVRVLSQLVAEAARRQVVEYTPGTSLTGKELQCTLVRQFV